MDLSRFFGLCFDSVFLSAHPRIEVFCSIRHPAPLQLRLQRLHHTLRQRQHPILIALATSHLHLASGYTHILHPQPYSSFAIPVEELRELAEGMVKQAVVTATQ